MAISVLDLFKVGIGPSSSHTVGPMRAALLFVSGLRDEGLLGQVAGVKAELFGSLGATGKGHGSDKAVLLGLEGEAPERVDPEQVDAILARIRGEHRIRLAGVQPVRFVEREHLVLHRRQSLPYHPNGMRLAAFDAAGALLCEKLYYSVGGGFVVDERPRLGGLQHRMNLDLHAFLPWKRDIFASLTPFHAISIAASAAGASRLWSPYQSRRSVNCNCAIHRL